MNSEAWCKDGQITDALWKVDEDKTPNKLTVHKKLVLKSDERARWIPRVSGELPPGRPACHLV